MKSPQAKDETSSNGQKRISWRDLDVGALSAEVSMAILTDKDNRERLKSQLIIKIVCYVRFT
ncbi:MAG: hypothetical protein C5B52_05025 [Bacteroidetes bacterium]|nr:MAG: hypothetical protein C5B52_05025 [Bacteroidota bacterium]